jgi:predicted Holliday junction resolvase-like endonuclease
MADADDMRTEAQKDEDAGEKLHKAADMEENAEKIHEEAGKAADDARTDADVSTGVPS